MTASDEDVAPGQQFLYNDVVTNLGGTTLTGASASVVLPTEIDPFNPAGSENYCGGTCSPGESASRSIGTLTPGQEVSMTYTPSVSNTAPLGELLRSSLTVTATGSNLVSLRADALIGESVVGSIVSSAPRPRPGYVLSITSSPFPVTNRIVFRVTLPAAEPIRLGIHDASGRLVGEIRDELGAGPHDIPWSPSQLPGGMHFYRLDTAQGTRTGTFLRIP